MLHFRKGDRQPERGLAGNNRETITECKEEWQGMNKQNLRVDHLADGLCTFQVRAWVAPQSAMAAVW